MGGSSSKEPLDGLLARPVGSLGSERCRGWVQCPGLCACRRRGVSPPCLWCALGVLWQLFMAQKHRIGVVGGGGGALFCSWCGIASLSRPPFAPKCQGKTPWRCFGWAAPCPPASCPRRTRSQVYLHAGGPHANTPGPSAHPASPPQLGASPAWLRDLPRSSSRGAAQRGGRLARPLKRQQILLSAHSSRSVKSQSIHQQLSVVCRLQAPRCLRSRAHRVGVGGLQVSTDAPRDPEIWDPTKRGPYKTGTLQASSSKVRRIWGSGKQGLGLISPLLTRGEPSCGCSLRSPTSLGPGRWQPGARSPSPRQLCCQ